MDSGSSGVNSDSCTGSDSEGLSCTERARRSAVISKEKSKLAPSSSKSSPSKSKSGSPKREEVGSPSLA